MSNSVINDVLGLKKLEARVQVDLLWCSWSTLDPSKLWYGTPLIRNSKRIRLCHVSYHLLDRISRSFTSVRLLTLTVWEEGWAYNHTHVLKTLNLVLVLMVTRRKEMKATRAWVTIRFPGSSPFSTMPLDTLKPSVSGRWCKQSELAKCFRFPLCVNKHHLTVPHKMLIMLPFWLPAFQFRWLTRNIRHFNNENSFLQYTFNFLFLINIQWNISICGVCLLIYWKLILFPGNVTWVALLG